MSDANRKSKLTMLLMASLITTNFAFADNAYKNNVVDVKVNKEANNAVMVTIYTDKPYTEPVVVNKKANNKYVILMPETKSSLKSAPSVANMSGTVSNVSVNTQAVSGSKGYTKIVITSEKAITVVPRMQQLSTSSTQPASAAAVQKAQQEARAKAAAQKAAADKAKKDAEAKKLVEQKAQQEAQAKKTAAVKAQKNAEAKRQAQQKAQQAAKEKQLAVQKAAQQTALTQTQKTKQPIEILEQEIKTDKNAKFMQSTNDPILNKEIQENAEKNRLKNAKKKKTTLHETNNNRQSVMDNIKAVLRDYKNVSLWKLLLLAGAITFPVIVIIIILGLDKKINRRIDKSFKKEDDIIYKQADTVQSVDISSQTDIEPNFSSTDDSHSFNSFEEMLDKVEEQAPSFHKEQLNKVQNTEQKHNVDNLDVVSDINFENDFEKEDFEHDFEIETEAGAASDDTSSEAVLQQEDMAVPKQVQKPDEATLQPAEPYVPDGYLSDFSGVNDKEFFDELVMQSMAENNANGLPDSLPADEIFDYMTESEKTVEPKNTQDLVSEIAGATSDSVKPVNTDDLSNTVDFNDNTVTDNKEPVENIREVYSDSTNAVQNDDGLTMLTEVKLNDSSGLYLVNYENFSSLVGHINDDYFVIKKFDDLVNSDIILKQTEKIKDITRYLVRVGKNKMVVEVSPTSMNRLLDL